MKALSLAVLLFASFFALLSAQQHPRISEVFHAQVLFHVHDHEGDFSGHGVWAGDQPHGRSVERFDSEVHHNHISTEILERYDLGRGYEITRDICHSWHLTHHMPEIWGWVQHASFKGKHLHQGKLCDLWEFREHGHAFLSLLVDENHPDVPVWFQRDTPQRVTTVEFAFFEPKVHEDVFRVPQKCSNHTEMMDVASPSSLGCVARNGMISRAQEWVNKHVPYNQGGTHDGYREDCSGYVSMAWQLGKPGLTTRTLPGVSHKIAKKDLKEGDVLLNVAEHVVLFGGWADSSHSHYVAYEETRPGEGTVKRVTPYPYWYSTNLFVPYRYNSAC